MMAFLYVAGPVVRQGMEYAKAASLTSLYGTIQEYFDPPSGFWSRPPHWTRASCYLPRVESEIDRLGAREFAGVIRSRIEKSGHIVTFFTGDDPSPVVEATVASEFKKGQSIVFKDGVRVPRLLEGLQGVQAVEPVSRLSEVLSAIRLPGY